MQVSSLVAEVAAKHAQLRALEALHEALVSKARALDQLVASAGELSAEDLRGNCVHLCSTSGVA